MSENIDQIKRKMEQLKDEVLLEIVNIDFKEYRSEAIEAAKEELKNRGFENFSVQEHVEAASEENEKYLPFRNIVLISRFEDIVKSMKALYPCDDKMLTKYKRVFDELLRIKPSNINNIYIDIDKSQNIYNQSISDWEINGVDLETEEKFDISFYSWEDWLSFRTKGDQVDRIGKENYIAHCLYKMTTYGFTEEEIYEKYNKVQNGVEEILDNELMYDENETEIHPWLRYWARGIDYSLFSMCVYYIISLLPVNIANPIMLINKIIVVIPLIWIIFEAFFLSTFGTTPGKWIFGIFVRNSKMQSLTFGEALNRSILVWAIGMGCGIIYIEFFANIYSYFKINKNGITDWDRKCEYKIVHKEIGIYKIIMAIVIIVGIPLLRYSRII